MQDYWGQTPLSLLIIHAGLRFRDDPDSKLWTRVAEMVVFMLQHGASPATLNMKGESAYVLGSAKAQEAMRLAEAVMRGEATLEKVAEGDLEAIQNQQSSVDAGILADESATATNEATQDASAVTDVDVGTVADESVTATLEGNPDALMDGEDVHGNSEALGASRETELATETVRVYATVSGECCVQH